MTFGANSRYNYSTVVRIVSAAGLRVEPDHVDSRPPLSRTSFPDNVQYTAGSTDTWSRLGWSRLGSGKLYWIIADFSGVVDPHTELQPQSKTKYVAQLGERLLAGTVNKAKLSDVRKIKRGMRLHIEDLTPSTGVSIDVAVVDVDSTTKQITFSPAALAVDIPWETSRVSYVYKQPRVLTIPTASRAYFEALDFSNLLNTLQAL